MNKNGFVKVVSMGPLDLDFTLALTEEEIIKFGVPEIPSINSLQDCRGFLLAEVPSGQDNSRVESILDHVRISSNNSGLTSLLMINKAFKNKTFIEYLTLSETIYTEEFSFMKEVVKYVTEQNFLFIVENALLEVPARLKFTIKLAETKDSNLIKTFEMNLKGHPNNLAYTSLYYNLNYNFENCNYFYLDANHIFELSKFALQFNIFSEFLKSLTNNYKEVNVVVNFPDVIHNVTSYDLDITSVMSALNELIAYTDTFIFEKKEAAEMFNLIAEESQEKKLELQFLSHLTKHRRSFPKIGLFFDELKGLTVIEQQARTNLILFHSDFEFKFAPAGISQVLSEDYKKLLVVHQSELKFTFLGGFLSRMIYKKSFNTCFTAGRESVKRILELLRFGLDCPIDNNFYIVRIKQQGEINRAKLHEGLLKSRKEEHFVLDCINLQSSSKKNYNPLYDQSLQSFFSSISTRNHLKKLGFINRKGQILQDPDCKKLGRVKNPKLLRSYEEEQKKLLRLKENNTKMKLQINNLFQGGTHNLLNFNLVELENFSKVDNFQTISGKKLPSVSNETIPVVGNIKTLVKKESSLHRNDLYAKAIAENHKKSYNSSGNSFSVKRAGKTFNKNGLKPLSRENYLRILDNYEGKAQVSKDVNVDNDNEKEDKRSKENVLVEVEEENNPTVEDKPITVPGSII